MTMKGISVVRNTAMTTISIRVVLWASLCCRLSRILWLLEKEMHSFRNWKIDANLPLFLWRGVFSSLFPPLLVKLEFKVLPLVSLFLLRSAVFRAEQRRMLSTTREMQGRRWTKTTQNLIGQNILLNHIAWLNDELTRRKARSIYQCWWNWSSLRSVRKNRGNIRSIHQISTRYSSRKCRQRKMGFERNRELDTWQILNSFYKNKFILFSWTSLKFV